MIVRSNLKGQLLADRVFELLKREIVTGGMKPAEVFNEGAMAKRLNASRTPIREASNRLRNAGLLISVPNKGHIVAPITIKDILNVYELRMLVEPVCAESAARNLSDEEVTELEALLQPEREHLEDTPHMTLIDLNKEFHIRLARAKKNDRIVSLVDSLLLTAARMDYAFVDLYPTQHTGHAEILARLKVHDATGAREAMFRHIQQSKQRMSIIFSSEGFALSPVSRERVRTFTK